MLGSVLAIGGVELSANKSIEDNIKKSRRAFFPFGSIGLFQGDISPISSRSALVLCVMPILLYGSENWILTESMVKKLEAFQGKLVKEYSNGLNIFPILLLSWR